MKLSTTGINSHAVKLYKKLLATHAIPEDAAWGAYEGFVRHMRSWRDRHPETREVAPRFAARAERWACSRVMRARDRERFRDELVREAARQAAEPPDAGAGYGHTFMFQKMEAVFSGWIKRKPAAAAFVRVFLLDNAWFLSARRVRLFARLVDGKKSAFVRDVKAVKKYVETRTGIALKKRVAAAEHWHLAGLKADLQARGATATRCRALRQRRQDCLERKRKALERLEKTKLKPPVRELARIAGVSIEKVRHSLRACDQVLKRSLG